MSNREGFTWQEIRINDEVVGVRRMYGGKDCFDRGIAPFVEWYFVDTAELDERGQGHDITMEQYDTLLALHEDAPKYMW